MRNAFTLMFIFFFLSCCIVIPVYNYEEIWVEATAGGWMPTDDTVTYGQDMLNGTVFQKDSVVQIKDGNFSIKVENTVDEYVHFSLYSVTEQLWSIYKITVGENVYYTAFRFKSISDKSTLYVSVDPPRTSPDGLSLPSFSNMFLKKN